MEDDRGFFGFGLACKKIFFPNCVELGMIEKIWVWKKFFNDKKYGDGMRIYMGDEDWDGDRGENLNGNKWEKIGEDKMGFGGQWMDEPPYRKRSVFKGFWRFWHPPLGNNSEK